MRAEPHFPGEEELEGATLIPHLGTAAQKRLERLFVDL